MADRYDLKIARTDRNGKTWWTKIGVMFPMKERDGFNITLEALPIQQLNDDGRLECRITAWEPYKEDRPKSNGGGRAEAKEATPTLDDKADPAVEAAGLDDKIPF
jgi:hypothetical protein